MKIKFVSKCLILAAFILGTIPGCTAATPVPLPSPSPVPPTLAPPPVKSTAKPNNPPGNQAPVMENHSLVSGNILAISADPKNSAMTRIQIHVTASNPVQGSVSFTDDKVGSDIDVLVKPAPASTVKIGDSIQIQVSYRGDEFGGNYYGSDLSLTQ